MVWSKAVKGLQIRYDIPEGPHKIGDSISLNLHFKNVGNDEIRIYLIRSEAFRFGQSSLSLISIKDGKQITSQPPPRPHGIVIDEEDFHLIKANLESKFTQTLYLNKSEIRTWGEFIVRWKYSNKITRWPGGKMTLDGPTKELFGGKDIPFIWTGKIEYEGKITIVT